jgi:hypothetical protein
MNSEEPHQIPLRWRIGLLVGASVITALATVGTGLGFLLYALYFPSGLCEMLMPKNWDLPVSDAVLLILGWALYVGLIIAALLQKRRWRYFVVYGILCVLLALNAAGCHHDLSQPMNFD